MHSVKQITLTQDAINNEIYNYWKSNNFTLKRINKNDIKFATNHLIKKIRIEEQYGHNMHPAFLERNRIKHMEFFSDSFENRIYDN
ncbi:hypothetical protein BpHYR1_036165 [Brachionus plicatilis]|uniref:Uncharacterized protein n=1 Tax=Brachionus plicatilis TaxID=10195 RepID=A0A3M7STP5_BRAPC|nr:hypothetical protein BpHYR1_036165 [Brachionus plicatilis]